MSVYFEVEGVSEVVRLLHEVEPNLEAEVTQALGELAREAALRAASNAMAQGFGKPGRSGRGTGKLVRDIKYSVTRGKAFLRETALRDGAYRYPAVFEFGHSEKWGSRPFLMPAIREIEPESYRRVEEAADRAVDEFNHGVNTI